jgi:hypothetical protein
MPDTILEENHPRIISANFGWDWLCSFRSKSEFLPQFIKMTKATFVFFFTEVIKFYWLMLLLYPGELYRLLGASSWYESIIIQTHFWKRTIQWLFHQNFVLIEQMVSDKKIFMGISHRVLC